MCAFRVEETDIRRVSQVGDTFDVTLFHRIANTLVDTVEDNDDQSLLTTALKREIELLLAAHFCEHKDQLYTSKSTDGASASFQGQFGMGLLSTKYGQSAVELDITGYLRGLAQGVTECSLDWGGLPPSEQTAYVDRD